MSCFLSTIPSGNKPVAIPAAVVQAPSIPTNQLPPSQVKLTKFASGLGCACKMNQTALMKVLNLIQKESSGKNKDPKLLLGNETADDASVYQLTDDLAIIQTTDFFPPIVDDPYMYGKIATANAISDVYAMNGVPITALSIVGFPSDKLSHEVLAEILRGSQKVAEEAEISISGGHTIEDLEPKFGLAVTGICHPNDFIRNNTIQDGDVLILTKKLGSGIATTSLKKEFKLPADQQTNEQKMIDEVMNSMAELNKVGQQAIQKIHKKYGTKIVHGLTDVTGFGFSGHLTGMLNPDNLDAENSNLHVAFIDVSALPLFPLSKSLVKEHGAKTLSGGLFTNAQYAGNRLRWTCSGNEKLMKEMKPFVVDPQTSGGLLMAVDPKYVSEILELLPEKTRIIGKIKFVPKTEEMMKCFELDNKIKKVASSIVLYNSETNEDLSGTGKKLTVSELEQNVEEMLKTKKIWSPEFNFSLEDYLADLKATTTTTTQKAKINPDKIFLLSSFKMGDEPQLGKKLLLGFFQNLLNYHELPNKIIIVGTAYSLTTGVGEGADPKFIEIFKKFEEKGTEIVTCITCIEHFSVVDQLKVGRIGNAKENVELFMSKNVVTLT